MVYKCCVPNCRGNYNRQNKVSVFKFPADEEEKRKWIKAIRRENFTPTKNSVVCELHFLSADICRATVFLCDDGTEIHLPLQNPRLEPGAVPILLPDCPTFPGARKHPEVKQKKTENQQVCELHFRENEVSRSISAFDEKSKRWLSAPLSHPRLVKDAVPSIFPESPSTDIFFSTEVPRKKKKAVCSDDDETDIKIEIKDEPVWLDQSSDVEFLPQASPVSNHSAEDDSECHFESSMFTQSKEGRRNLKINAVPSVPTPKSRTTQIQKINAAPNKNTNREAEEVQLRLPPQSPHNKRKRLGFIEQHAPATKRKRTIPAKLRNDIDEHSAIPVTDILNKHTQIQSKRAPSASKAVTGLHKIEMTENEKKVRRKWSEECMKQAVEKVISNKMTVREASEAFSLPRSTLADRLRAVLSKQNQTGNECAPYVQKEAARDPKRRQMETGMAPSVQKETPRVLRQSQTETEGEPAAQKETAKFPKNVEHDVLPLEKTKVVKAPDKEVGLEKATGTKDRPRKSWCKLDEICRLCIKRCQRPTNVYESDLAFKIEAITSITGMYPADGLPVNVCQDCKDMTNIFYSFKLQCEATDETLKSCLKVLQQEDSNGTVVKQQTVAKPLFPELFKFSAVSSDESDVEEVDSEIMEEEEALKVIQVAQRVPVTPAVQTVTAAPVVQIKPAVQKTPVVQAATPSTSATRTRKRSPPSRSLQDELDKAWTEFSNDEDDLSPVRKSTDTTRKEIKPQLTEVKGVEKRKPVQKSVLSSKQLVVAPSTSQNKFGLRKEQPHKEGTPQQVYKPQLLERQTKPLQGKAQLIKYLGSSVEVIQQKQPKGAAIGNVMVTMANNPKKAYNTNIDKRTSVNLPQKTLALSAGNKADKRNGSDSLFGVKRLTTEASEIRKLGPALSAYKVGALGKNVEIYRIPGQKPKPLLSKPVVVENKGSTSKADVPLKRAQTQERTPKIQESNGHLTQASKPENSQLCHIEIFKVQNHGDGKLCLTTLEGTDVSLQPVTQVPNTKLVSLANKLEQNLQPVKSNSRIQTGDSTATMGKLQENFQHGKDQDNAGKLQQNLQLASTSNSKIDMQGTESNASKGKLEQNLPVVTADIKDVSDDSAYGTVELEPGSDPKLHIEDGDNDAADPNLQSKLSSDKVQEADNDKSPAAEKMLQTELLSDANENDDESTARTELDSDPVLTIDAPVHLEDVETTTPTSEKSMKTFPRPCKGISLPSSAVATAIAKKVEAAIEIEPKEQADVTKNNNEGECQEKMVLQEQEGCADMAKTIEVEKGSDITHNIVEELLNGAAMFADTDSVEPELPLSLGEPESKAPDDTEHLGDTHKNRDETELQQDISKLIDQSEEATDCGKVEDKKVIDKTGDATAEELETVEETLELQNSFGGGAVVQDSDEKLVDGKQELDGQCHICAKSFPLNVLQRHIASHWSQKDLLCEKCGISFFFPADLERHVISHGPQDLAGNKEDTRTVKRQLVSRQRIFTCGACRMDFTNWFQLRDHRLIHKKGRRHRCGSCSKHFRTKYLLQNHMWVHTILKKPSCELCGKTFSLPWYVDRHIEEEHS